MTAVLYVDHLRGNTWLNDGARLGLWGATIGANIAGGAASGYAAAKAATKAARSEAKREVLSRPVPSGGPSERVLRNELKAKYAKISSTSPTPRWTEYRTDVWNQELMVAFLQLRTNKERITWAVDMVPRPQHHQIAIVVRSGAATVGTDVTGYVSNPWGSPLSHPRGDGSDTASGAATSFESVPRPAEFTGTGSVGSEAPSRGMYEIVNE